MIGLKVRVNTLEVNNLLSGISRRQSKAIRKSLNRVSNMAIGMITTRTQKGKKPDGGSFIPYTKKSKAIRQGKGRQTAFVDLTDTGKMFRSLDLDREVLKILYYLQTKKEKK